MENYTKWIPVLERELKTEMAKTPKEKQSPAHQKDHIERVWKTSKKLGKLMSADMEALVAAVYLHDIGRHYGYEFHGPKSAKYAKDVLKRIDFPEKKREKVLQAISTHDYATLASERTSIESKILYDADKLDAFGKIGIERHNKFYLSKCKTKKEKVEMLNKILEMLEKRWNGLELEESRKIGKKDYDLIYNYFEKIYEDLSSS